MKEVEATTDGSVRLGPGTLYGITKRLLADGLIVEMPSDGAMPGRRGRRDFQLSPLGRAVAEAESLRLEAVLQIARSKRLLPEPA